LYLTIRTPSYILYDQASVLPLEKLYEYYAALFVYKSLNLPSTILPCLHSIFKPITQVHTHLTRASSSQSLFNPSCSITTRKNHIALQGPLVWNSIPTGIKCEPSLLKFKKQLEAYLKTQ
jgi:hypothetical protein